MTRTAGAAAIRTMLMITALAMTSGPARVALCAEPGATAESATGAGATTAPTDSTKPVTLVVFDFDSPGDPKLGPKLTDAMRLRAGRLPGVVVVDGLSISEAVAAAERPVVESEPDVVGGMVRARFGADVGLWGRVTKDDKGVYTIEALAVDVREGSPRPLWRDVLRAEKPQMVNPRCDEILTAATGAEKANRPREADPEAAARAKVKPTNLVRNGGFEELEKEGPGAGVDPVAWERVNGLTTFIEDGGEGHGRALRMDTDVYEREYSRWIAEFNAGKAAADAPKKTPTHGPKYDTVGGNYGVHLYSAAIPVEPGKTYRLEIDYRCRSGDFFFPKLFFRGWADVEGEDRIVWDGYLSLRSMERTGEWKHNVRLITVPRPDEISGRRIKYMKVMIYAYWPPGEYWFDNVGVYEVVESADNAAPPGKK